ncbi:hypothetical protein NLI96_g7277 [Meripilus lineatus]|uniref:Uncharacterized protein n=1 Tax=Meripilus lineatus TaxID=2056292 RepID=A0AAD5YF66_9APHY|nr:hypothetical protein NLI96_g7277 [Physisporinus lineatus]
MRFSTSLIFLGAVVSAIPAFAAPQTYERALYVECSPDPYFGLSYRSASMQAHDYLLSYDRDYDLDARDYLDIDLYVRSTSNLVDPTPASSYAGTWIAQQQGSDDGDNKSHNSKAPLISPKGSQSSIHSNDSKSKKKGKFKKVAKKMLNAMKGKKANGKRDTIDYELVAREIERILSRDFVELSA